jgi:formylglycine-generating enzyme required for sulfatase activity
LSAIELILRDPLGERPLAAADFPLSVGGPGNTIVLPGSDGATLAWLALHDGQLYLEPVAGTDPPLCNGVPLARSSWLRAGDVVDIARGRLRVGTRDGRALIEVEDGSGGNLTVPPAPPAVTMVAGGGDDADEPIESVAFRRPPAQARARPPVGPALIAGALVTLLGLVVWFLVSGRAVTIASDPADSDIRVRGGLVLSMAGHHFARPGDYRVEIRRAGYETLRAPLRVSDAPNQTFRFRLARLPGLVDVQTPVAARVSVAGKDAGSAPGTITLPAGRHELQVVAERHLPFATNIEVQGAGQRQTLVVPLVPAWSLVTVLTQPVGATVLVDGKAAGVTPAKLELDAGTHRVELRQAGFKPWITDIQVVANKPQTLGPVQLGLPDGTLIVRTEPAGASVSVGGAFRGRGPVTLDVRPEVSLDVVASRDGYEPATAQVTVPAGERREVRLALTPVLGEITVLAEPASAEVYVGGRVVGRSGEAFRLPATRTDIEVRLAGFRTHRVAVIPRPGLPQVLNVRLEAGSDPAGTAPTAAAAAAAAAPGAGSAAPAATPKPLTAIARTSSGAELRLLGPATFTMGSARRESGRRANESQRPVELRRRFYLGTRELTNGEFKQYRAQHRSGFVGQQTLELERQPAVNVSWQEAAEYCNWLSQKEGLPAAYQLQGGKLVPVQPATTGYRLPSEAEWEWAARANPDGSLRKYPWGDALPVPAGAGNFADRRAQPLLQTFLETLDDGFAVTAPVGSFAANPLGLFDLGGNVAEWTTDLYTVQPAGAAVAVDPLVAAPGNSHVIRGSSWRHATVTELRAAFRDSGNGRRDDVGFRIARYAE